MDEANVINIDASLYFMSSTEVVYLSTCLQTIHDAHCKGEGNHFDRDDHTVTLEC